MANNKSVKKERLKEEEKEEMKKNSVSEEEENLEKKKLKKEDEEMKKEAEEETEKEAFDDEEEEEEEEEEMKAKKKKAMKGEMGGENPEESGQISTTEPHSTSPGMGVPSTQNVFVPSSDAHVAREQHLPMDGMHKSVDIDLKKSPLFVNLSGQIDGIKETMSKRLDSIEKSVNDRLNNVLKDLEKIEKFYQGPLYKALGENAVDKINQPDTLQKQIQEGKVKYRQ